MNKLVRNYLIELSRKKINQTITYQKLSDDCKLGLDMGNLTDRLKLGDILGDISKYEHLSNRPLLSALVVKASSNYEGDGFYKLAEELGFGKWSDLKKDGLFDISQIKESIDFWSDDNNYSKFKAI